MIGQSASPSSDELKKEITSKAIRDLERKLKGKNTNSESSKCSGEKRFQNELEVRSAESWRQDYRYK